MNPPNIEGIGSVKEPGCKTCHSHAHGEKRFVGVQLVSIILYALTFAIALAWNDSIKATLRSWLGTHDIKGLWIYTFLVTAIGVVAVTLAYKTMRVKRKV
jgi:hypothetical protein